MKPITRFSLIVCCSILSLSCKKEAIPTEQKAEPYVQHFSANINGTSVSIKNTIDNNRGLLRGSWTGVGIGTKPMINMYTVNVLLPKAVPYMDYDSKLIFQIFDIKTGLNRITGEDDYYKDFGTFIAITRRTGDRSNDIMYTANKQKKPFEVSISRYEIPKNSMTPIVGGTLRGVLYNTKNIQDSIVIDQAKFEVRY